MNATRTMSLALCFQEPLTAILRVRQQRQQVQDAESFRNQMRRALHGSLQEARNLGYSSDVVQMTAFAVVAYLDESVLNLQSAVLAEWSRRPLQEELFGGHMAGEVFFRNFKDLLGRPDAVEIADSLEVHCLCLLLGYRGRYALGGNGEIEALLRQAREKTARSRVTASPFASATPPEIIHSAGPDRWGRWLGIAAACLAAAALVLYGGLDFALRSGMGQVR